MGNFIYWGLIIGFSIALVLWGVYARFEKFQNERRKSYNRYAGNEMNKGNVPIPFDEEKW